MNPCIYGVMPYQRNQILKKYYIDKSNQLAVCGDWCFQGKVESAFFKCLLVSDRGILIQFNSIEE